MKQILLALSFLCCTGIAAQQKQDTTRLIVLDQVEVYSFRTLEPVRETPASVSVFARRFIERNGIDTPNKLTAFSPNFYMPAYGSALTSAIYIRGVGSRMNDPAVGLYADNIPYLDKSTYDFDLYDLARIEVLRGPQGSLYGRNAMGGIISLFTPSPLEKQGTRALVTYGSGNTWQLGVVHRALAAKNVGITAGVNYRSSDGFFTNMYNGEPADRTTSMGARLRADWRISDRWLLNLALSGERSSQDGYPYGMVDADGHVQAPDYNDPMGYDRNMLVASAYWQYMGRGYSIAGTTSYQYFDDHLQLDQDFTPADLFTLEQLQTQHAFTQEVIAKSVNKRSYQWLAGVFGFYKKLSTDAPVVLKKDFFSDMFAGMPPQAPKMSVRGDCTTAGTYGTPSYGLAAFHQSSLRAGAFTFAVGLRMDYENVSIDHTTAAALDLRAIVSPFAPAIDYTESLAMQGHDSRSFWQFTPKLSINYSLRGENRVYLSVARGYRSGGYNIQLFSDIASGNLRTAAQANRTMKSELVQPVIDEGNLFYLPEYSWNYEAGGRLLLFGERLQADAAVFYIDSRNQQVTQFVSTGLGRIMKNAARSRSCGAEFAMHGYFGKYTLYAAYGFTSAKFKHYTDTIQVNGQALPVDYGGRFVPFVPRHTVSAGVERTFALRNAWVDAIVAGVRYQGIGRVYFTENNDAAQNFYSLLDAEFGVVKQGFALKLWARNLTDADYKLFSFYNRVNGKSFAQIGNPFQVGATLKMDF